MMNLLIAFALMMQPTDCKKLFEGKWRYRHIATEDLFVVRTLDKQFEYVENGKYYYEFKIKWLSDCKYELTYIGTTSPVPAAANINEKCIVTIIGIDAGFMKYKTVFRDQLDVGEMDRVKE